MKGAGFFRRQQKPRLVAIDPGHTHRTTPGAQRHEAAFRAGQLHATFTLPVGKIGAWRTQDAARLRIDPMLQINYLRFNTTKPEPPAAM